MLLNYKFRCLRNCLRFPSLNFEKPKQCIQWDPDSDGGTVYDRYFDPRQGLRWHIYNAAGENQRFYGGRMPMVRAVEEKTRVKARVLGGLHLIEFVAHASVCIVGLAAYTAFLLLTGATCLSVGLALWLARRNASGSLYIGQLAMEDAWGAAGDMAAIAALLLVSPLNVVVPEFNVHVLRTHLW